MFDNMTDEEFFAEIEKQYGEDWKPEDLSPEFAEEYAKRVSTGF